MACEASSSLPISTKANPRGRPVSRSITTFTSTTFFPPSAKTSRSSGSVTLYDKLPTYSLVPISFSFVHSLGFATRASGSNFQSNLHAGEHTRDGGKLRARAENALRGSWRTGAAGKGSCTCIDEHSTQDSLTFPG